MEENTDGEALVDGSGPPWDVTVLVEEGVEAEGCRGGGDVSLPFKGR